MKARTFTSVAGARRQPIVVSDASVVRRSYLDARELPLVVQPALEQLNLPTWLAANRESVDRDLLRHGAVLFRGFDLHSADDFAAICEAATGGLLEYKERSSPRSQIAGNIYTSTDYPPDKPIYLHNEQSYNLTFPIRILFFCAIAPSSRGATPIADVRKVYQRIDPSIRRRFQERGYMYVRNFGRGFGLPWQTSFQTDRRDEVEAYCRKSRITCEWQPADRLRTRQVRQVAAHHPVSGEAVWFNHATFFHVSTLEASMRESLLASMAIEDLPNHTYYGDGQPIEAEVMDHLRAAYDAETVTFPWQVGDVLLMDNMLAAHAREPFDGPRRVMVGMAQPHTWDDVRQPGLER
jgi:alpha-ketoglutarate-dependent taurine dioxygenase